MALRDQRVTSKLRQEPPIRILTSELVSSPYTFSRADTECFFPLEQTDIEG